MKLLLGTILRKWMTVRGFIVFDDFGHLYPEFNKRIGDWVTQGTIQYREEKISRVGTGPWRIRWPSERRAYGKRVVRLSD